MISIRRSLVVATIFGAVALTAAALPRPDLRLSFAYHPGTKLATATDYDGNRHLLQVRCVTSSTGNCHFALESAGRRKIVILEPGRTATLANIAEAGRICSSAVELTSTSCTWHPILDLKDQV
ncbi:hypothetical protein MC45_18195 (plasmid) [Sphingomonas taxi]|uniref:Uncharacterized protein n=1 Tax=Sphingomonas taxi TaxID=1549858 RepID=A0A097ELJ8_9SPHN|nr:hypothetical protein [Sphingomonas taxi]AIT08442.1 hypothetical protein MC45_18195 [Sphingomonas taxi]